MEVCTGFPGETKECRVTQLQVIYKLLVDGILATGEVYSETMSTKFSLQQNQRVKGSKLLS